MIFSAPHAQQGTSVLTTYAGQEIPAWTEVPSVPRARSWQERTAYETVSKETGETVEFMVPARAAPLSDQYVSYNISALAVQIKAKLISWEVNGTRGSLPQISDIKELLDRYSTYAVGNPQLDILLGYLELIFSNSNWAELSADQINQLVREIDRFGSGSVSWKDLQTFSRRLFKSGFSTLKHEHEEEKAEAAG